nr:extensin-like [Penaeus vannamei]
MPGGGVRWVDFRSSATRQPLHASHPARLHMHARTRNPRRPYTKTETPAVAAPPRPQPPHTRPYTKTETPAVARAHARSRPHPARTRRPPAVATPPRPQPPTPAHTKTETPPRPHAPHPPTPRPSSRLGMKKRDTTPKPENHTRSIPSHLPTSPSLPPSLRRQNH